MRVKWSHAHDSQCTLVEAESASAMPAAFWIGPECRTGTLVEDVALR